MSTMIYGQPTGGALSIEISRIVYRIVRVVEGFVEAWEARCAIRDLEALDDRMLADMGITRNGIKDAVLHGR